MTTLVGGDRRQKAGRVEHGGGGLAKFAKVITLATIGVVAGLRKFFSHKT
ncbi:hypothetical protein CCP3SC1_40035 [Gammaproteobacteria bacterium]